MGNDVDRPRITIEVDEADKNQVIQSLTFMKRSMRGQSINDAKNSILVHHWIQIELENSKTYNIESLGDQYKISLVTNWDLRESIKNFTIHVEEKNLTLEEFYKISFEKVKKYDPIRNNCIHFVEMVQKTFAPNLIINPGDLFLRIVNFFINRPNRWNYNG